MIQPESYSPTHKLSKYISHYGILEAPEGVVEPYFSPPLGLSGFILQTINTSDVVIAKIEERDFFTDGAVVTGQVTSPIYGQIIGKVKSILIFFQPLGMYQLFGTDMATITNKAIKLDDFLGETKARALMQNLKADQNSQRQIEVLDDFFLYVRPVANDTNQLARVLDYIHEKQGGISIDEIENYGHYHRKTLERHFRKMVGLSPKVYAQIYRFKCLINLLQSNPEITWTQLANQAGYYDQSHMSRYVKEYLKVSPNSIVKLDMNLINYLLKW